MGRMKRAGALLLCVAFVLTLFVSSAYLIHEAGHTHCTEEDCPVCRTIATAVSFLRALGLVILVLFGLSAPGVCRLFRQVLSGTPAPASGTLVSWKIRLND